MNVRGVWGAILWLVVGALSAKAGPSDKSLTVEDIMKFRHIQDVVVSEDGRWTAYSSEPDRGDGEGVVRAVAGEAAYRVERGHQPVIDKTGRWAAMTLKPPARELEAAGKDKKKREALKPGMALVSLTDGDTRQWEKVKSFAFSDDGRWLARLSHDPRPEPESADTVKIEKPGEARSEPEKKAPEEGADKGEKKKDLGALLTLRRLADGVEFEIDGVAGYAFDPKGRFLVYALSLEEGVGNGLYYRALDQAGEAVALAALPRAAFPEMVWDREGERLAFLQKQTPEKSEEKDGEAAETEVVDGLEPEAEPPADPLAGKRCALRVWRPEKNRLEDVADVPGGWYVPDKNELQWSRDGRRLFFGLKREPAEPEKREKNEADAADEAAFFNAEALRAKRGLDVWHVKDPRIKPHERKAWEDDKKRTSPAVWHARDGKLVPLQIGEYAELEYEENERMLLVSDPEPHFAATTWSGPRRDWRAVDLRSGETVAVVENRSGFGDEPTLSPEGRYAVYYREGHVHLLDLRKGARRNLTAGLDVSFADEDHDYPSAPPGYGFGGWMEDDKAVLIYDKYDIWLAPVNGDAPTRLTRGREEELEFRIVATDPERRFYREGENALLYGYHHRLKYRGFWRMQAGRPGVAKLVDGPKYVDFIAKAKNADLFIYTRENFREFPDLWAANADFADPRRVTEENPQIAEFAWGEPELVEWRDLDGEDLQGVLIKPGNYEAGKRYPVIVYFYRFFSQRMHRFNEMRVNHRPNFPFYASHGYAIFLPDIRFEIGSPGEAAVEALVPGIQKLVDMGVADPDAIGLHGHSWSGYQTMYVITRTNAFACAVSGAPVGNMTSAYNGLRRGSGLARQFQYELGQSRIGATMWERRDLYIDNSPVFFADRIHTPTLIMFGDADTAVPWEQGVELYLAMRRFGKDVVFLQYHDEPHHLKKYPNKVDYTLKMKEYFDHYLKGAPAPAWLAEGEPYRGD